MRKFIGQHIYDLVSRFRNDIFVSKVSGDSTIELQSWSTTASHSGTLKFLKSGTAALDTYTAGNHTTAGEVLGRIEAFGVTDGDSPVLSSYIEFSNDAVSDADSVPGKIIFATSDADDAGTPTVRLSIDDGGQALFTGDVVLDGGKFQLDAVNLQNVQTSAESFANNDTSFMTSAAIATYIASFGYSTGDITGVRLTDDSGSSISDNAGSADFTIAGGSGITTSGSSTTMTIAGDDATTSAKGVASFSEDNFAVSSGAVTIKSSGVDLTDEVTGTLPIANGGTGSTSTTYCDLTANVTGVLPSANMDSDTAHLSGTQTFTGVKTFPSAIFDGDVSVTPRDGAKIHVDAATITDSNTSASGTAAMNTVVSIEAHTLAATNASVTNTNAASLYIGNAPAAGTNMTITNAYALWVDAGNARFDADLSIGGNLTITGDITSVGDDVSVGDNILLTSASGVIQFTGTAGGGGEGVQYKDAGGGNRYGLLFPGSDVVAVANRASNGTVQLRANTSTAGSSGEVTQVTVEDDKVTVKDNITCLDGENDEFTVRPNLYFFATNTSATVMGSSVEGSLPDTDSTVITLTQAQNSSASVFSLASNEVTIARAGLYKMTFNATIEINNGSNRCESFVGLVQETSGGTVTLIDGTEGRGYHRFVAGATNAASGQSMSASAIVNVAANSKYTLRFGLHNLDVSGQKLRTIDEGTSFLIEAIT